jgi:dipeptide transport system substrate-binding protein
LKKKKLGTMLVTGMLSFALVACTANKDAGTDPKAKDNGKKEAKVEKVLNLNNGQEPTSFDPPIGFDAVSWNSLNNLMEGLTRLGPDNQPQAATASKWDLSADGKTYTFHIRSNAKWSNGDDVKASDFVYSWKRLLDPKTGSSAAFLGYFIEGGEAYNTGKGSADDVKVKAVDDKTLEVTLNSPSSYFLSIISNPCFFPIDEKVATANPKWFAEANTFVGNGPFNLSDWQHDSEFTFTKNPKYWDAKHVKIDKVHWAMVNDENTEYQMYKTGDLDTSDVPAELADQLFKSGDVKVEDQAGEYFYRFNLTKAPFQNENIRKAFALAVNQQQMVDLVTKNKEKPAYGFVSYGFKDPNGKDFRKTSGDLIKTDVAKAKELLKKGMEEEGYKTLPEVTLTYSTSDQHKKIAEALQQMFKENLGVDVKLANMEASVFATDQKALKFQLSRSSFLADYPDPINFLENFITGSPMNRTGWSNAQFDQLIKDAKNEKDDKKRYDMMYQAEKIFLDAAPIIPIHFYNQVYLQNKNVTGIVRHPVGYLELKWADKK